MYFAWLGVAREREVGRVWWKYVVEVTYICTCRGELKHRGYIIDRDVMSIWVRLLL